MRKNLPVSVISPVYNNTRTLEYVLGRIITVLSKHFKTYEIVLIDDASSDDSYTKIKHIIKNNKHIRLIQHKKNQGIAKTYRHLYREAEYEHIVLFSLDGEWEPNDIVRLFNAAQNKKADIVIGQRIKKAYSLTRLMVSEIYNIINKILFGVTTKDAGSIKYLRKKVTNLPIISAGVFDEAERIIRAKKNGYTITSIPVSHYSSKKTTSFGVKPHLITQALYDCIRVYFSLQRQNYHL